MNDDATPELMTISEFARHIRRDESWVRRLRDAGRLDLAPDGRVRVRESVELILATSGDRPDVADRHAERRAEEVDPDATRRRARAEAELRIKRAEADRAEIARDREAGALLDREEVGFAMRDIGAAVRVHLENFPGQVAPLIAERVGVDRIGDIEAVLQAECTRTLQLIADKLREPQPSDKR